MRHMHIVLGFGIFASMPDGMRKLFVHLISMASRTVMLHIAQLRIDMTIAPGGVMPAGFLVLVRKGFVQELLERFHSFHP